MDSARAARRPAAVAARLMVLLAMPVLILFAGHLAAHAAGPRWIGATYDPDYQYALNALSIAEGHAPRHTDHPGTTVQTFGAAVLWARHWFTGAHGPLRLSVLADPESAAAAISGGLRLVHVAALLALGAAALGYTRSLVCAVAAQAATMMSLTALVSIWRVSPEPLLMAMGCFTGAATLMALARSGPPRARFAVVSGLLLGLSVATKVTSLPLAFLPLWGVRGLRRWALYGSMGLLALVAAVSPILAQMPRIASWFWGLLVNSGRYGTAGEHAVLEPSKYLAALIEMARAAPIGVGVVGASLILLALTRGPGRFGLDTELGKARRALACACVTEILQFLLVAKHPEARYLLPGLSVVGVNICTGWVLARELSSRRSLVATSVLSALVLGGVGAVTLFEFRGWSETARARCRGGAAAHESARRAAAERGGVVVYYYGSSSMEYGLWYADWWTGHRYRADLARMYHEVWVYDVWKGQFQINGTPADPERIRETIVDGELLFQGPPDGRPADLEFTRLGDGGWERVYLARSPAKK